MGYKGLQGVTRGYQGSCKAAGGCKRLTARGVAVGEQHAAELVLYVGDEPLEPAPRQREGEDCP